MSRGLLGIEIGAQKVRYVYAEKRLRELCFLKAGEIKLKDTSSFPSTSAVLIKEILSKEKIAPSKIFLTIFREDILFHQLTLPKMSPREIEEVIVGEIEKLPAFLDKKFEFIWSSYAINERRTKVIFGAVLKNFLDYITQGAREEKINLESLELSPLNLLEIVYSLNGEEEKEQALVVLDERISYILIISKKRCEFLYLSTTGKQDFYSSQEKKINKYAFLNWIEELRRVFKSYCVEYRKEDIKEILFVWDNEDFSNLDKILARELDKKVRVLNLTLVPGVRVDFERGKNPIYILSAAPIISCFRNLKSEFLFDKFLFESRLKKLIRKTILLSIAYLLIVSGVSFKMIFDLRLEEQEAKEVFREINSEIRYLERRTAALRRERHEYMKIKEKLLQQASYVKRLNRISWSKVFTEVAAQLPQDMSLDLFSISENGEVKFRGEAFKIESVANLMRKIEKSSVLENPKFDFLRERKKENKKIFNFGILAELKKEDFDEKSFNNLEK